MPQIRFSTVVMILAAGIGATWLVCNTISAVRYEALERSCLWESMP